MHKPEVHPAKLFRIKIKNLTARMSYPYILDDATVSLATYTLDEYRMRSLRSLSILLEKLLTGKDATQIGRGHAGPS